MVKIPLRVLLIGPPYSGKRVVVEELARQFNVTTSRFEHYDQDWRNVGSYVTISLRGIQVRIATLSGAVTPSSWLHFLGNADSCVFILDSQPSQLDSNIRLVELSARALRPSVALVVWSKTDLSNSDVLAPRVQDALRVAAIEYEVRPSGSALAAATAVLSWLGNRLPTQ